jgi:hypothetical protein
MFLRQWAAACVTISFLAACSGGQDKPVKASVAATTTVPFYAGASVPDKVITGPLNPELVHEGGPEPAPLDDQGYWSQISFRYLGDASCEPGGSGYPCYLPLRTAPDFRSEVGVPITQDWPAEGQDWVWVQCQADGNKVPDQGELHSTSGEKSNRWNLVGLGNDTFAWGNQLWFSVKGPVNTDGTPRFACKASDVPSRIYK